jgi:DNA invertase Pin-like site-specific DNA recombinase
MRKQIKKSEGKAFGYLRVSTLSQDLQKDKHEILMLANDLKLGSIQWTEETISGKVSWKDRKLFPLIESMTSGDALVCSELSRLGRSMLEIMEILSIAVQRGIHIYAVKGNWRLDDTIQSKIVAMGFSIASEIERSLISSRTTTALQALKAKGIKLGRPAGTYKSKLDPYEAEIKALLANHSTKTFIAQKYHTTPANFHFWLKKRGLYKSSRGVTGARINDREQRHS